MRRLLDTEEWDAACLVFVSPDRIQHCLLEYVHPGHPRHAEAAASPVADRVRGVYRMLDRELGTLIERTDDEDTVVLMSDHGHQPCTRALNMNRVLEHLGHLRLGRGSGLVGLLAWGRLRSIARVAYDKLGLHGRVAVPTSPSTGRHGGLHERRLDRRGRLDRASRARAGRARRTGGVRAGPRRGGRVAARVHRPRDRRAPDPGRAAEGGRAGRAVPRPGTRPAARGGPALLPHPRPPDGRGGGWLSGDHRPEGIYVAAGPGAAAADGSEISLADFAGMIEAAVGLGAGADDAPAEAAAGVFTADEEREVEERLRGLGYLE